MFRKQTLFLTIVLLAAYFLGACGRATLTTTQTPAGTPARTAGMTQVITETTSATRPATGAFTEAPTAAEAVTEAPTAQGTASAGQVEGIQTIEAATVLVAVKAGDDPTLDGAASEAAWRKAQPATIPVAGGANLGATQVSIRSIYTDHKIYFLVTWVDPTQSWMRIPWEKQPGGTWKKLTDPEDQGGDNNLFYEDKFAFIWPIHNSVPGFESTGCFVACHAGENPGIKPYGNKYLAEEGQLADIWHWVSVCGLNQVDDQYLDHTRYSEGTPGAGLHSDPDTGGGCISNGTEDGSRPAFMPLDGGNKDGSPGYILDGDKLPFDDSQFQVGDRLPSIVTAALQGDRGQISAGWVYADGMWTLEFGRDLVTGSEFDVQFDNLGSTYFFALAAFDNAEVRHAFQTGATALTFEQ